MLDLYLVINLAVTLALLALGASTILKNRKPTLHKLFALFTVAVSVWIMTSYFSNDVAYPPGVSLIGNYFVFAFSYLSSYLLLWFAVTLARDKKARARLRLMDIPILVIGILSGTPLVVAGVERQQYVYAIHFGVLAWLYGVAIIAILTSTLVVLKKNIKRRKGNQRNHLRTLYRTLIIALPIILLTEFILPAITGWFGLTNIGILFMAIPVVGLYYSVVKLRLFDLRLLVVRSLAYILVVAVLVLLYSTAIGLGLRFFTPIRLSLSNEVLLILSVAVSGVIYGPLKVYFDKVTRRVFYRNAHDPQELYDLLNRLLVSSIDLEYILTESANIITTMLQAEYCTISVNTSVNDKTYRIFGSHKIVMDKQTYGRLYELASDFPQKVISVDSLDKTSQQPIKDLMISYGIEVLVQLTHDIRTHNRGLGLILIGPNKSGTPYSDQDVRALESVANELVIATQNALHFDEIQRFNLTLKGKVDEATRKLRTTNERLKKLDETKDEFISMASHQLRTPLTSIKGYLSMVLEGDAGKINPMQEEMLKQSFLSSQRMVNLIADLLNLSRLNTGKFVIDRQPTDLRVVVEQELAQLKEAAKAKDIELVYQAPKEFPILPLDDNKIHQVVMNFADNAIYYTPAGGKVEVSLVETPTTVEYRVKDNGIGVPRGMQPHLFTKFYRAENAKRMRPDGTGLGIFMAKKVVIAQGGAIIFESEEGKGSTFGFRFPKEMPSETRPTESTSKLK